MFSGLRLCIINSEIMYLANPSGFTVPSIMNASVFQVLYNSLNTTNRTFKILSKYHFSFKKEREKKTKRKKNVHTIMIPGLQNKFLYTFPLKEGNKLKRCMIISMSLYSQNESS